MARPSNKHFYKFNFSKLSQKQRFYLENEYGRGVFGYKRYKKVLKELSIIEKAEITKTDYTYELDFYRAKQEFKGDKRIFNSIKIPGENDFTEVDKENDEGENLLRYARLNSNYVLAYLKVPGFGGTPIDSIQIISNSKLGGFR